MKKLLIMTLLAILPLAIWANEPEMGNQRFDPEKFQKMVEESITKAAGLTPEEAQALFPLFNEMKAKQREIGLKIYQLKKCANGDCKAYAKTINEINDLKVEMAQVESEYYIRILKVLPAEKVFKVMKADDDFHRRMVQGQHRKGNKTQKGSRKH